MTRDQQDRLREWADRCQRAGELRGRSVYDVAARASSDLGFAVGHEEMAVAWKLAITAERRERGATTCWS